MSGKSIWRRAGASALPLALLTIAGAARADVTLPLLVSDHMVLQRGKAVRVWGSADPRERVSVEIAGKSATAVAGPDGKWLATLPALPAGGPYEMTIKGKNTRTLKDVLVGEVWICSGQSNMEWPLAAAFGAEKEIAGSSDSGLRMFNVVKSISDTPQDELAGGAWQAASPQTSGNFSAVGYYFAKQLRRALGVPVGMIHTSWGGTRIEAWTSRPTLEKAGTPAVEFLAIDKSSPQYQTALARRDQLVARWKAAGSPSGPATDIQDRRYRGWERAEFDDAAWAAANVPGEWDSLGVAELDGIDGSVWFRKTVEVSAAQAGKAATLNLGAIDDHDTTWVNGKKVGATDAKTPNSWTVARHYAVPAGVLKAGKNVIAVRVFDGQGGGGMVGKPEEVSLTVGGETIPLAGPWKYLGERIVPTTPPGLPGGNPNAASALYNAMFAPLANATVTGAIWYQGESNAGNPMKYRTQINQMIADWRQTLGNPELYFFASQLAPFVNDGNQRTSYAEIREAFTMAGERDPRVGAAVITDVGEEKDIHPKKKGPVGQRLALLAQEIAYGQEGVGRSPRFKEALYSFGKALVRFDRVGGGLKVQGGLASENPVPGDRVVGFQLAGEDGVFYPAEGKIVDKDTVEVTSEKVPAPKKVRFGFVNFPIVNLFGGTGLPVDPFRSDRP